MMKLADAMHDADYVLIDGVVFETEYLRVPDEFTVAEDVVLEAKHGDDEVTLMRDDLDDAEFIGDGVYRLKSGSLLRFLTSATSTDRRASSREGATTTVVPARGSVAFVAKPTPLDSRFRGNDDRAG